MHARIRQSVARRRGQGLVVFLCAWIVLTAPAHGSHLAEVSGSAPDGPLCGNGVLEPGEACETCATDCTVRPCDAGSGSYRLAVELNTPTTEKVAAATVLITYRAGTVLLPGKGSAPSVRERVQIIPSDTFAAVNDRDYALRVALARPLELRSGRLLNVAFDTCNAESSPSREDFSCIVEGCGGNAGPITGCTCTVSPAQDAVATVR